MVVHLFLFTDVLLVTKPIKKGGDRYSVVRPVRGHHTNKSHIDQTHFYSCSFLYSLTRSLLLYWALLNQVRCLTASNAISLSLWYYVLLLCIGSFLVIELNDFGVLTSWFILKAHTSDIAKKWMDHINSTQVRIKSQLLKQIISPYYTSVCVISLN